MDFPREVEHMVKRVRSTATRCFTTHPFARLDLLHYLLIGDPFERCLDRRLLLALLFQSIEGFDVLERQPSSLAATCWTRNELESQLFGNLEAVGFGHVDVVQSKRHLRDLLAADRRGLIVSMIHKFDEIPKDVCTRSNFFVLIDEAHRSTGGDLGNYLMGALPNATYLGFTGTPIDRTAYGKGMFKVFGMDDEKGFLDKYSIKELVADGTTVPLHYQLAPNELLVDRETLEKEFLSLADAEGISDRHFRQARKSTGLRLQGR